MMPWQTSLQDRQLSFSKMEQKISEFSEFRESDKSLQPELESI